MHIVSKKTLIDPIALSKFLAYIWYGKLHPVMISSCVKWRNRDRKDLILVKVKFSLCFKLRNEKDKPFLCYVFGLSMVLVSLSSRYSHKNVSVPIINCVTRMALLLYLNASGV